MLSKEVIEKHYLDENMTYQEIASRYGVSAAGVRKWAIKYGIKSKKRPGATRKVPVSDEALVNHYISEKMTLEEIGEKYGVSHVTVGRILRTNGVSSRTAVDYAETLDKDVLEHFYLLEKLTCEEIAVKLGKTKRVVYRNIKLYGIPTRPACNSLGKPCNKNVAKKISQALKGKSKSEEHRKKLSLSKSGVNNPNFGKPSRHAKRCWYICPNGSTVSMRSNWEVAYAEWLNQNNIQWEYEPKTFILNDGSAYTPDFYLNATDEFIEVKGWFTDDHKNRVAKFRNANPNCKLTIADKQYLEGLGIDLKQKFVSTRPKFQCEQCGNEFYRIYKTQRMCSKTCSNRYISSHRKGVK